MLGIVLLWQKQLSLGSTRREFFYQDSWISFAVTPPYPSRCFGTGSQGGIICLHGNEIQFWTLNPENSILNSENSTLNSELWKLNSQFCITNLPFRHPKPLFLHLNTQFPYPKCQFRYPNLPFRHPNLSFLQSNTQFRKPKHSFRHCNTQFWTLNAEFCITNLSFRHFKYNFITLKNRKLPSLSFDSAQDDLVRIVNYLSHHWNKKSLSLG